MQACSRRVCRNGGTVSLFCLRDSCESGGVVQGYLKCCTFYHNPNIHVRGVRWTRQFLLFQQHEELVGWLIGLYCWQLDSPCNRHSKSEALNLNGFGEEDLSPYLYEVSSGSSCGLVKKLVRVRVSLLIVTDVTVRSKRNASVFKDLPSGGCNFRQLRQVVKFVRTFRTVVRNLKVPALNGADYPLGT